MGREERLRIRITGEEKSWDRLNTLLSKLKLARDVENRPDEISRLDFRIKDLEADRAEVEARLGDLEDQLTALRGAETTSPKATGDQGGAHTKPVTVFYSYAHEDEGLRDELEKHLAQLKREGVISSWHDRAIRPGTEWDPDISERLDTADIILLLVSPDFLASDYIASKELTRAMERHNANEAVVIPIILRDVDWTNAPFSKLQAVPKNAKPVSLWPDRDQVLADIARSIGLVARELASPSPGSG